MHSGQNRRPEPCDPGLLCRSVSLSLSATTRTSAATAATPAIVVLLRPSSAPAAGKLTGRHWRVFNSIEVRLVLLVELLRLVFVEVLAALNQDGALIRARLALLGFLPLPRRWTGLTTLCLERTSFDIVVID